MGTYLNLDDVTVWREEPTGPPRGGLIVIHEIWGLVQHTRDVAARFAAEGYVVYAPDILADAIETPEIGELLQSIIADPDDARRNAEQPRLRAAFAAPHAPGFAEKAVRRLTTTLDALEREPGVDGRIGVVGFCFGGSYAFELAAADPRIRASVPFYGSSPDPSKMPGISCPVLALYGEEDTALVDALPALRDDMTSAGVDFRDHVYPDAGHAFFNDANQRQYRAAAAKAAWPEVLEFLNRTLTA